MAVAIEPVTEQQVFELVVLGESQTIEELEDREAGGDLLQGGLFGGGVGVEILEVGDRRVVINGAGLEEDEPLEPGRRVFVEGSFYLDVDLVGVDASLAIPMRGTYRLAAVRRHRPGPPGRPPTSERLTRIPAPEDVDPAVFLHVADLVGPVRAQP